MKTLTGLTAVFVLALAPAWADGLSLTIGAPVAAQGQNMSGPPYPMSKMASFVFRLNGCADNPGAQVTARAEGIVAGSRVSVPLKPSTAQASGVFGIAPQWGNQGKWVVAITATCKGEITGAIVAVAGYDFKRDSSRLLSHAPTQAEIEADLKAWNEAPAQ